MLADLALLIAACCFTAGLVLQAHGSRVGDHEWALSLPLIGTRVGRSWIVGTLATFVGFGLELYALRSLPVAYVQPVLSAGIVLVPLWAWVTLGERLTVREGVAISIVVAGVILMQRASGSSSPNDVRVPGWRELATLVLALALLAFSAWRSRNPTTLVVLAGAASGCLTLAAKLIATSLPFELAWTVGWLGVATCGTVALIAETTVLRVRSPSAVAPLTLFVTTLLPIVLAVVWFDERWKDVTTMLVALALALGGIIALSRGTSPTA